MLGYRNDLVTDIVSVIDGPIRFLGLSGLRSAETENASDFLIGGGVVDPISVIDGGLGEGVFALEGGGESTSSSGDEQGEHLFEEDSQGFGSCEMVEGTISSPL